MAVKRDNFSFLMYREMVGLEGLYCKYTAINWLQMERTDGGTGTFLYSYQIEEFTGVLAEWTEHTRI